MLCLSRQGQRHPLLGAAAISGQQLPPVPWVPASHRSGVGTGGPRGGFERPGRRQAAEALEGRIVVQTRRETPLPTPSGDRLVPQDLWRAPQRGHRLPPLARAERRSLRDPSGGPQEAERLGIARHAGQRHGVDRRPEGKLSRGRGHRSGGSVDRSLPYRARLWLAGRSQDLSGCLPTLELADESGAGAGVQDRHGWKGAISRAAMSAALVGAVRGRRIPI